jgi:transcriptional regulator with GAF, ATPase, and Fis domain
MLEQLQESVQSLMDDFRIINETTSTDTEDKKAFINYFTKLFELQSLIEKELPRMIEKSGDTTTVDNNSHYESLYKSSLLLSTSLEESDILNMAVDTIIKMTGVGRGFISTLSSKGEYKHIVSRNTEEKDLEEKKQELSNTLIRRMLEKKDVLAVSNGDFDKDLLEQSSIIRLKNSQTICSPVYINEELGALIYLDRFESLDYKKVEVVKAFASQMSCLLRNSELFSSLKKENKHLLSELRNRYQFSHIIGRSAKMVDILKMVSRVADTLATVQIQGESGTGKDLIARALHENSSRADKTMIQVDCGALPASLIESELFGHKKGSFTGAQTEKIGLLEAANGGTIFLDELANMPLDTQTKLLRALQTKSVRRIGETIERQSDFRLIVASSRDLKSEMEEGRFREDLYYRINTISIALPPLRERREDILELAQFFIEKYSKIYQKKNIQMSPEFLKAIEYYTWKGNVRELEHMIERAIILAENKRLTLSDLPAEFSAVEKNELISSTSDSLEDFVNKAKKKYIERILTECEGKKIEAAKRLGIDRSYLFTLSKKLEIQ